MKSLKPAVGLRYESYIIKIKNTHNKRSNDQNMITYVKKYHVLIHFTFYLISLWSIILSSISVCEKVKLNHPKNWVVKDC